MDPTKALLVVNNVSDEHKLREKLAEIGPYTVVIAHTIAEVEEMFGCCTRNPDGTFAAPAKCPAFVLLDLTLPNGKGLAVIRKLRAACGYVSLLVYTELRDEPVEAYHEAGADGFFEVGGSTRQLAWILSEATRKTKVRNLAADRQVVFQKELDQVDILVNKMFRRTAQLEGVEGA